MKCTLNTAKSSASLYRKPGKITRMACFWTLSNILLKYRGRAAQAGEAYSTVDRTIEQYTETRSHVDIPAFFRTVNHKGI